MVKARIRRTRNALPRPKEESTSSLKKKAARLRKKLSSREKRAPMSQVGWDDSKKTGHPFEDVF